MENILFLLAPLPCISSYTLAHGSWGWSLATFGFFFLI
jgi:hypothetical protein